MILLIGPGGCGFSFLAWSMVFLRGSHSYQKLDGSIVQVPDSPITSKNNAHGFDRDHLIDIGGIDLQSIIDTASDQVVYVVPYDQDSMDRMVRLRCKKLFFSGIGYHKQILSRMLTKIKTKSELIKQLETRWSVEQYMPVLMTQARRVIPRLPNDLSDSMVIDYETMFLHLENTIEDLMRWCGLGVQSCRMAAWRQVYRQWQISNCHDVSISLQKFDKNLDPAEAKDIARFLYTWWKQS